MFGRKLPLYYQIEEYLSWKKEKSTMAVINDEIWLIKFSRFCRKSSVEEITHTDFLRFREIVGLQGGRYAILDSSRAIRSFLRYFKARKYLCISPLLIEKA